MALNNKHSTNVVFRSKIINTRQMLCSGVKGFTCIDQMFIFFISNPTLFIVYKVCR